MQRLEHAEHDGADKGECEISGNNAQSADEAHGKSPWFTSLPVVTLEPSSAFPPKKVSLAVHPGDVHSMEPPATWLKICEINALKSP
jgi:hypothetical protein